MVGLLIVLFLLGVSILIMALFINDVLSDDGWAYGSTIGVVVFGTFFLIFIIGVPIVQLNGERVVIWLQESRNLIELQMKNENLTAEERSYAIDKAREYNIEIKTVRAYSKNPFIGLFYYRGVGELELIDYSSLMPADEKHTIELITK